MEKDGRVGKSLLVVPREKSGQGMVIVDIDSSQQKVTEG